MHLQEGPTPLEDLIGQLFEGRPNISSAWAYRDCLMHEEYMPTLVEHSFP